MANQVEIIVRAVDEASKVLQDVENNATKSLGGVEAAAEKSAAGLAMIASAATAAVGAALALGAAFAKSYGELLSFAEGLDKANQSTGVSVEFLQKLIKTSDEMDISFDSMRGVIERLEKNLEGSGAALRKFGIDVADYQKLTPDEAVRRFADQLEAIKDPMEKTAVAMAATGKAGAENIAMWHAIAIGAVDAQEALGGKTVESLLKTEQALDSLTTSWKTLKQEFVAVTASSLGLEERFRGLAADAQALARILDQWPGLWQALGRGVIDTTVHMIEAAKAAREQEVQIPKTSQAVLGLTETNRKLQLGLDELVKLWEKEAKAEDKAAKEAEAAAKKREALSKKQVKLYEDEVKARRMLGDADAKETKAAEDGLARLTASFIKNYQVQEAAHKKAWAEMARAAAASYAMVDFVGAASFFKTRTELQKTADEARFRYQQMLDAGKATYQELQAAHAAYKQAEADLNAKSSVSAIQGFELIASSASSILRSLFGKSKAAAIAAAIIDTLAAIVKTMAAYPWPWNLVPAAAAAVAGYAQVQKIRNTDAGFAQGTPGTSFVDFGAGTPSMLHGQEAVVTRPQAEGVASMVRDAIKEGLRGGRGATAAPTRMDLHVHLDGREIASSVGRRFQAGLAPALAR